MNCSRINKYYSTNPNTIKVGSYLSDDELNIASLEKKQHSRHYKVVLLSPLEHEREAIMREKPRYCKICGECAQWAEYNELIPHNAKKCPYKKYYNIESQKEYKTLIADILITEQKEKDFNYARILEMEQKIANLEKKQPNENEKQNN